MESHCNGRLVIPLVSNIVDSDDSIVLSEIHDVVESTDQNIYISEKGRSYFR